MFYGEKGLCFDLGLGGGETLLSQLPVKERLGVAVRFFDELTIWAGEGPRVVDLGAQELRREN